MSTATDTPYQLIAVDRLRESPLNPRKHFDPKKLEELTASVRTLGRVRVPLLVRPAPGGLFEIGAGHRRYRAAKAVGLERVPAIVEDLSDEAFVELLQFENLNREDLHELEEAEGFQRLLDMPAGKWDIAAIAARIGKSPSHVYERLHLLKLVKPVREAFFKGEIVAGHATDIARLAPDDQLEALKAAQGKGHQFRREPMSVRELRDYIQREIVRDLGKAPFDTKDAELLVTAGACGPCPKRAANNPQLFDELAKGDRCMDGSCFTQKVELWLDGVRAKAKAEGHKVVNLRAGYGGSGKGLDSSKWQGARDKQCDDFALGVVIEPGYSAGGSLQLGQVVKVCLKPQKCKVHNPKAAAQRTTSRSAASTSRETTDPKRDLRERVDEKVFELLRHKVKTPLVQPDLAIIVGDVLRGAAALKLIAKAYGWKVADLLNETTLAGRLSKMSIGDLGRLLVEAVLAREIEDSFGANDKPVMTALARRYGIDVKKVEADLKAEDATKAKATKKPASGSAAKKASAKKGGKKGGAK